MKPFYITPEYGDREGICVQYTKSSQQLSISGWYDGFVGIEGRTMSLSEFFKNLGITKKCCDKVFE